MNDPKLMKELIQLRQEIEGPADKYLLRRVINRIEYLEKLLMDIKRTARKAE